MKKLLQKAVCITLTACLILGFIPISVHAAEQAVMTEGKAVNYGTSSTKTAKVKIKVNEKYTQAFQVLSIVNKERKKAGLDAVTMDKKMLDAAMFRAAELSLNVSHTRPNGTICFTAFPAGSHHMGENLAVGQPDASSVMDAWMNSPGHRANILEKDYSTIGIGCVEVDGYLYWIQCFGTSLKGKATVGSYTDKVKTRTISVSTNPQYYQPNIQFSSNTANTGGKIQVSVNWYNGFVTIPLSSESLKYKISNNAVCIASKGNIKGVGAGMTTVKAYFPGYEKGGIKIKINIIGDYYKVRFNANKGKNLSTSSVNIGKGKAIGKLATVKRSGYEFKGWYTKSSGGSKVTAKTKIKRSQVLYAQWKKS